MADVTLRDLATATFVGVAESDTARGTARLLASEGADRAVVLRGSEPVGSISAATVLSALDEDGAIDDVPVSDLMGDPPPVLAAAESPAAAAAELANGAPQVLVAHGNELLGAVTPHDLLAAGAFGADGTPASAAAPPEADTGVAVAAAAGTDPDHNTQGICEGCGSFARELATVDGQLLCPDCRAF